MKAKAEKLRAEIARHINGKYPGADFRSRAFDCFAAVPEKLRRVALADYLEAELANGGLAQFLWNAFYHRETVLSESKAAYEMFGVAKQAAAIDALAATIREHAAECETHIRRAEQTNDPDAFLAWYENAEEAMLVPEEELFFDNDELECARDAWLVTNAQRLRALMK